MARIDVVTAAHQRMHDFAGFHAHSPSGAVVEIFTNSADTAINTSVARPMEDPEAVFHAGPA